MDENLQEITPEQDLFRRARLYIVKALFANQGLEPVGLKAVYVGPDKKEEDGV